jgi:CheY-like chemotaxis protein
VEDNLMNQRVATYTLENWEAHITIADRGQKAIDLLKKNEYDVILMDLQMPEMSGIQATEIIRQQLQNTTPIIAMTASAMSTERERCLTAGMNDYISKPFAPEELNRKIVQHSRKKEAPQQLPINVINLQYMKELTNNDAYFMKDILKIYIERTPELVAEIKNHIATQQHSLLHGYIHNLKNSAGILGATSLYELLQLAELDVIGHPPSETTIEMLLKTLDTTILQSIAEARKIVETLQ